MLYVDASVPAFLRVNAISAFGALSSLVIIRTVRMTAPFFANNLVRRLLSLMATEGMLFQSCLGSRNPDGNAFAGDCTKCLSVERCLVLPMIRFRTSPDKPAPVSVFRRNFPSPQCASNLLSDSTSDQICCQPAVSGMHHS